jgi:hypothetical protein
VSGQIRRSQAITTWGPGSLLDLPRDSVIVGGLDAWPPLRNLDEVIEPRLTRKLETMTGVTSPRLYAPPVDATIPGVTAPGIGVYRFPRWFVVQEDNAPQPGRARSTRLRRLVSRRALDRGRFEGISVIPTRFVRACLRGHVDDLDWFTFVHRSGETCRRQLTLEETGTSGDLADIRVRCECGSSRSMLDAADQSLRALGPCPGRRPWLGGGVGDERCDRPARLLIRTAANAYFAQVVSVLSLPEQASVLHGAVRELWGEFEDATAIEDIALLRRLRRRVRESLEMFTDAEVWDAVSAIRSGGIDERPVKQVEIETILAAPEGFGDDIPVNPDFHARKLPRDIWRQSNRTDGIEAVIQLHRLREVQALSGFTRFEAEVPDINGEFDTDVERAPLALDPQWFPAVENRGEGVLIQLRASAVDDWRQRAPVKERLDGLYAGYARWRAKRNSSREFPGGPYVLLHSLAHLLIQSLALRSGYPASSIRERVYADSLMGRYGILLYTGTPDAEGTLGGLVQQARHFEDHLLYALEAAGLCSNDPVCAQHLPGESIEGRWLHGAACHACSFIAETSCEMRNDYLDRALVVPVLGRDTAAFFGRVP